MWRFYNILLTSTYATVVSYINFSLDIGFVLLLVRGFWSLFGLPLLYCPARVWHYIFILFFRLLPSRCIQPICFFLHHGTLSAYNVSVTRSTLAFLCYCQSNCNSCCICTYVCFSFGFARGERTNVMQIAKVRKRFSSTKCARKTSSGCVLGRETTSITLPSGVDGMSWDEANMRLGWERQDWRCYGFDCCGICRTAKG